MIKKRGDGRVGKWKAEDECRGGLSSSVLWGWKGLKWSGLWLVVGWPAAPGNRCENYWLTKFILINDIYSVTLEG